MNCKFINVLVFTAGAAIGSAVTWKIMTDRCEKLVQEEVERFKKDYAECMSNAQAKSESGDESEDEEDSHQIDWSDLEDLDDEDDEDDGLNDYERVVNKYTNKEGGAENMARAPYVISPYDFGELDDYSQVELTYYADGILEDDEYHIVTDADELIGPNALNTFGEYEDDSVFVRNERLRADFQILKDYRTYDEARSISPARVDDE